MFGALDDFLNEKYLKSHSEGTLIVGKEGTSAYSLKVFASMRSSAKDKMIFSPTESTGTEDYIKVRG